MQSGGTIKLMDGLYIGDQHSARDFVLLNQISWVVNCTGVFLPNYYQHYQIGYRNVQWKLFLLDTIIGEEVACFIERGRQRGESVMIHGYESLQQSVAVAAIYIMRRFRWSLFKTLEYLHFRIDGLVLKGETFRLLERNEEELLGEDKGLSYNWERRPDDQEELILRNTFLNATERLMKGPFGNIKKKVSKNRVSWNIQLKQDEPNCLGIESSHRDGQTQLRDRILWNVRKIIKEGSMKRIDSLSTYPSGRSLMKQEQKSQRTLTMQKHKSSSLLVSLAFLQRAETLKGKFTSAQTESEIGVKTIRKERMKTEGVQHCKSKEINNIESIPTERGKESISFQPSVSLRKITSRERSQSSKILTTQLVENNQNMSKTICQLKNR